MKYEMKYVIQKIGGVWDKAIILKEGGYKKREIGKGEYNVSLFNNYWIDLRSDEIFVQ